MNDEIELISYLRNKEIQELEEIINDLVTVTKKHLKIQKNIELMIEIVKPEKIREINSEFRGIDKVTDVLSFPVFESIAEINQNFVEPVAIGDIFICFERAHEQSISYQHTLKRELAFLVCHGLLHLCGYDHIESSDAQAMEEMQEVILSEFNITR